MEVPTEAQLRPRLAGGQRRADRYAFWTPVGHVSAADMADKLRHRAAETGELRCYICGQPVDDTCGWHLDHVRPLAAGGRHCLSNLDVACATCNLVKSDLDLYDPPLDQFVPLLHRLRAIPTADLWDLDPKLARAVAVQPRPVPIDPGIGGFPTLPAVWAVLVAQSDPYRAMKLADIAAQSRVQGAAATQGQLDRDWNKLMGMSGLGSNSRARRQVPHDRRLPSTVVLATRVRARPGQWGVRGMRIRFRVRPLPGQFSGAVPPLPAPGKFPDFDEQDVRGISDPPDPPDKEALFS